MRMLEVTLCGQDDSRWDEYFLLLMENYAALSLPYEFADALSFIGDPIVQGDALLIRDADGRTAGVLGFVFQDEGCICQVEAVYIREEYRAGAAFFLLIQAFRDYLNERTPMPAMVQFWSPAERTDLRSLFGKRSRLVRTNEKAFGRIDLFEISPDQLVRYTSRWRGAPYA